MLPGSGEELPGHMATFHQEKRIFTQQSGKWLKNHLVYYKRENGGLENEPGSPSQVKHFSQHSRGTSTL